MMQQGKYQKAVKRSIGRKHSILILSLVLLLTVVAGGTAAYLIAATESVTNIFTPGEVEVTLTEKKTEDTKSDISFKNDGTVPVYIRATLVIYWKDTVDEVESIIPAPEGGMVKIGALCDGWFRVGDIYYYCNPVAPGDSTDVMLDTIKVTVPKGSTAKCYIDVRCEGIQAEPEDAVASAWKDVQVADGKLTAAG